MDASHDKCASQNTCKITRCDPSAEGSNPTTGCAFDPFECEAADNFCNTNECVDFSGCVTSPTDCREVNLGNETGATDSDNCDLHYCSRDNGGMCLYEEKKCQFALSGAGAIAIAGLGLAAIVGIIIGVILCIGCCVGGGLYAYRRRDEEEEDVHQGTNPLYESSGKKRENPLFSPKIFSSRKKNSARKKERAAARAAEEEF
eukprot:TRINITY_DN496_c0_g1_i4.p1 TRINITY_DN496_c0_g1~~TRINITY_DN496_c0_g1_i4.p1  ORF type:complete len:202 (+),score=43.40 TRINITY_DN496_c0_g1_i4:366-971(+)